MNLKGQNRRKTSDQQHQKNVETKARWETSKYLVSNQGVCRRCQWETHGLTMLNIKHDHVLKKETRKMNPVPC